MLRLHDKQLDRLFPYYFSVDASFYCREAGPSLMKLAPGLKGLPFTEAFVIVRPCINPTDRPDLSVFQHQPVVLKSKDRGNLILRGGFEKTEDGLYYFFGAPWFASVEELAGFGLTLDDFALHDPSFDLLHVIKTKEIVNDDSHEMLNTIHAQQKTQKALQKKLQTSANRLSALIAHLNAGILLENESRQIELVNQKFCDLFSLPYSPHELISADCKRLAKEASDFFLPENGFVETVMDRIAAQTTVIGEMLTTTDGRIFQRDFIPVWDGDQYLGHLWVYIDITASSKAQEQLQTQRRFYEQILNNIPADVAVFNEKHEYLFVNPVAIKDEHTRNWIIGKRDEDYCTIRNRALSMAAERREKFTQVLQTNRLLSWEETSVDGAGEKRVSLRRYFPVTDKFNNVQMVIGYGLDITERKKIEEEILRSEERYRHLFHYSQALILTHDQNGFIQNVNPAVCRLLGYEEQEIVGRHLSVFIYEKDREGIENNYLNKINTLHQTEGIFRIVSKEGRKIYLLYKNYLFSEKGVKSYIIGFSQDITARIIAEKELRLAKAKTEELAQAKQKFLADMSHEIRTPMNGIIGLASLMEKTTLTHEQSEQLAMLKHSANNLLVIVNDVLDLEKIISGKMELEQIPFDVAEKVKITLLSFTAKAEEKGIHLDYCSQLPSGLLVSGDPFRLAQILNNLINNAIKFTTQGSVHISTAIKKVEGQTVWIEYAVKDNGIGIAEEKISAIFDPYVQARSDISRKFGGTGLGLAICKNLVAMQNGEIGVDSRENEGSVFRFCIPYQKANELNHKETLPAEEDFSFLRNKKILVAEDVAINQYIIRRFLTGFGCQFTITEDGQAAVSELQQNDYDVVLMDIQMPVMGGIEATKAIRSLENRKKAAVPVVALTANALKGNKDEYIAAGMNDYLSKPYTEGGLHSTLARIFKTRVKDYNKTPAYKLNESLYSLDFLRSISKGDDDFVKKMTNLFLEMMPKSILDLQEAFKTEDYKKVQETVHKMRPSINYLSINSLKVIMAEIEQQVNGKVNTVLLADCIAQAETILGQCLVALSQNDGRGA